MTRRYAYAVSAPHEIRKDERIISGMFYGKGADQFAAGWARCFEDAIITRIYSPRAIATLKTGMRLPRYYKQ